MIHERRSGNKPQTDDLFSSLVDASDDAGDGEQTILDSELIGIYRLLLR
jgi:cytochrome P450